MHICSEHGCLGLQPAPLQTSCSNMTTCDSFPNDLIHRPSTDNGQITSFKHHFHFIKLPVNPSWNPKWCYDTTGGPDEKCLISVVAGLRLHMCCYRQKAFRII